MHSCWSIHSVTATTMLLITKIDFLSRPAFPASASRLHLPARSLFTATFAMPQTNLRPPSPPPSIQKRGAAAELHRYPRLYAEFVVKGISLQSSAMSCLLCNRTGPPLGGSFGTVTKMGLPQTSRRKSAFRGRFSCHSVLQIIIWKFFDCGCNLLLLRLAILSVESSIPDVTCMHMQSVKWAELEEEHLHCMRSPSNLVVEQ